MGAWPYESPGVTAGNMPGPVTAGGGEAEI